MKQARMTRREILNPWLSRLSPDGKARCEKEIEKQERAIRDMKAGTKPRRTASRIIEMTTPYKITASDYRLNYRLKVRA